LKLSEEKIQQMERLKEGQTQLSAATSQSRKDYRIDGYQNLLNKYGTPQDNTEAYTYVPEGRIPDMELTRHYESNGLFAKIIDIPAEEVVKHGFTLGIEDKSIEQSIKDTLDDLDFEEKASSAIKWARLYGGSIIVMMIDDGGELQDPVNWKKVKGIDELRVYERAIVQPDYSAMYNHFGDLDSRSKKSKFGEPQYFYVYSYTGSFVVHESRCLIFRNSKMPELGMIAEYRYWGIPEYVRIKRNLRETITAHGDAVKLLERSVQAIYKMKDLAQLLATDEGEEQALKRLQIIDMARGILNSIAIDSEGEDYGFQQFSVTGIKEVIDATCNMLSALTEIPQTKLFGRSPAGMSATGESDLENYYNFIGKIQKLMLKHNLMRIIDIICLAARKNGEIEEIPKIKLTFDPLWSLSEQEQASVDQTKASTAQTKANTAQIYVDMGALDPSEVRAGLKSADEYAIEDLIDDESGDILTPEERQALLELKMTDLASPEVPVDTTPTGPEAQPAAEAPQTDEDPRGSSAVLVIKDGKILCGHRKDGQGICGPGGHIEEGETPEEAAMRETWEEFGIELTELIPLGTLDGLDPEHGKPHIFLSTAFKGDVHPNTQEMENNAFTELHSLNKADLFAPFKSSIDMLMGVLADLFLLAEKQPLDESEDLVSDPQTDAEEASDTDEEEA